MALCLMASSHRTGLFDAMVLPPSTSDDCEKAEFEQAYVREWLGAWLQAIELIQPAPNLSYGGTRRVSYSCGWNKIVLPSWITIGAIAFVIGGVSDRCKGEKNAEKKWRWRSLRKVLGTTFHARNGKKTAGQSMMSSLESHTTCHLVKRAVTDPFAKAIRVRDVRCANWSRIASNSRIISAKSQFIGIDFQRNSGIANGEAMKKGSPCNIKLSYEVLPSKFPLYRTREVFDLTFRVRRKKV